MHQRTVYQYSKLQYRDLRNGKDLSVRCRRLLYSIPRWLYRMSTFWFSTVPSAKRMLNMYKPVGISGVKVDSAGCLITFTNRPSIP